MKLNEQATAVLGQLSGNNPYQVSDIAAAIDMPAELVREFVIALHREGYIEPFFVIGMRATKAGRAALSQKDKG